MLVYQRVNSAVCFKTNHPNKFNPGYWQLQGAAADGAGWEPRGHHWIQIKIWLVVWNHGLFMTFQHDPILELVNYYHN